MLTDGALRLLVLLHFDTLGFSPIQIAWLFLGYEAAGMVTNLSAGWLANRFGLTTTLFAGLGLQVVALIALTQLEPGWSVLASVSFVILAQTLSGVAKDLTKMSSKSAVKLLAPTANGGLFRWVAALTGSKNAVKGAGFFLGAVLLALIGFRGALMAMAIALALILVASVVFMPPGLPRGKKGTRFGEVFSTDRRINRLSLARMFLFGARDVWFVVGVPVYFEASLSDGTPAGHRAAFFLVGTFMALWVIAYGAVQTAAPKLLNAASRQQDEIAALAAHWVMALTVIPFALAALAFVASSPAPWLTATLAIGLLLFGFVFAVNSSMHSYLILAFTNAERVTIDVGFYYMSNAAGRLLGTLLSGASYQVGGLPLCLTTAGVLSGLSWLVVRRLDRGTLPQRWSSGSDEQA
ncbi:MAG: organoarsenical effux MFS transporter ArsJ [Paracoccaceae bacterium]|nr:organoarsenical effux MFS transporter ArsJ [Paracoccaceae bacterium]